MYLLSLLTSKQLWFVLLLSFLGDTTINDCETNKTAFLDCSVNIVEQFRHCVHVAILPGLGEITQRYMNLYRIDVSTTVCGLLQENGHSSDWHQMKGIGQIKGQHVCNCNNSNIEVDSLCHAIVMLSGRYCPITLLEQHISQAFSAC